MNFNQLKAIANECVFSMEGITVMKTEEYNYRLQQITQLTNNWNELEEWVKDNFRDCEIYVENDKKNIIKGNVYIKVLNKMKEIKGDNNE